MTNETVIKEFYAAFGRRDAEGMVKFYSADISFQDPAFGVLKGGQAKNMWRMLVGRGRDSTEITLLSCRTEGDKGFASWKAVYEYGPKRRKVVNHIEAHFEFKNGKIVKHVDKFNMWKWTRQALGLTGWLFGWSSFMRFKVQRRTNAFLKAFTELKG